MEFTSHSLLVNSRALELAGISETSPPITGGVVWKDAQGEPNGVLLENAGNYVMSLALTQSTAIDAAHKEGLVSALAYVNTFGITSVVDARTYWNRGVDKVTLLATFN